jgi:predicted DNA binding protein
MLDLLVKSSCGLSRIAHDFDKEVLSFSVLPVEKSFNSIVAFVEVKEKGQEYNMKSWKKRYNDFASLNWDKISSNGILVRGIKEGHGIVKTIAKYDATLITPTIAGDGYERFLILIKSKKNLDDVVNEISRNNEIISFNYGEATAKSILYWTSKIILDLSGVNNREFEVLYKAYKYGYFSWPREINLEELSYKINMSQPTIIYHIRNTIYKILSNILPSS